MALLRREVAVFAAVAAAVAAGLVLAVRGCDGGSAGTPARTVTTRPATTAAQPATPEDVVRAHLRGSDPELAAGTIVLSVGVTPTFGVVALRAGDRAVAVAVRRAGRGWRVDTAGPVRLRALRPDPRERVVRRTQLAAEILADAPIQEGGVWLDGLAVPTEGGGPSPRRLTMFAEAPQPLARGVHVVVAFASTAADAAALAWTFEVVEP